LAIKKGIGRIVKAGHKKRRSVPVFPGFLKLLFFVVLILPWLSACTKDTYPPTPRIVLPFTVQKAGTIVETEMRIVEHREYIFGLCVTYKEENQADRTRVRS